MAATMKKRIGAAPAVPADGDQPALPADEGRVYTFEKMPGRAATRVQVKIAKVAAEPFAAAFAALKSVKDADALEGMKMAAGFRAIREVLQKLDEEEFLEVQAMVMASVKCEGDAIDLDTTFADHPEEAWEVLIEELRWTFTTFFRGSLFASQLKSMLTIASRPSNPPTSTTTGTPPSPTIPPSAPSES